MIRIDLFVFVAVLILATTAAAVIGAWLWGRAVKREALADKERLLANTVFKTTFMAELRALEVEAQGILALREKVIGTEPPYGVCIYNLDYWAGKLQAFRDVVLKLGGKICGS